MAAIASLNGDLLTLKSRCVSNDGKITLEVSGEVRSSTICENDGDSLGKNLAQKALEKGFSGLV